MTNMESLYGSGKFTEIMQSVKLTEIKKISAEEVEFYTSEERFGIHGQLRKFMKGKNILKERKVFVWAEILQYQIPASFCGRIHQKNLRICFLMHLLSFPKNQKSLFL